MEEPEQEREDGTESSQGCGAGEAVRQRLGVRPASPRVPGQREQGRLTGALRGPPPPLCPPARPRPPPPAVAATASPSPPRPPGPSLRSASDQRPPRTRLSIANRRPGPDTSPSAELEGDASPTSLSARSLPLSARATPPPLTKLQNATTAARPSQDPPLCWRRTGSPVTLGLPPLDGPPPRAPRAACAHGHLGVVVLLP